MKIQFTLIVLGGNRQPPKKPMNVDLLNKLKEIHDKTFNIYQEVLDSNAKNRNDIEKGRGSNRASESFISDETKKHCGTLQLPSETTNRVKEERQLVPGIWSGAEAKLKEIPWQVLLSKSVHATSKSRGVGKEQSFFSIS